MTLLPVCEKLLRRLAFEHLLYCGLAVGVIASPSVKAAAMVFWQLERRWPWKRASLQPGIMKAIEV
jgi:hypothetical protein